MVEQSFNVCITGGEPTLHPHIKDIINELINIPKSQSIAIFTNLTRSVKFFKELPSSNKVVVFASYHPEFATDKFTERCLELSKTGILFSVHVTMSDKVMYWEQTRTLIDVLRDSNIPYRPCMLTPTRSYIPNYNDEIVQLITPYLETTGINTSGNDFFKTIDVTYEDGSVKYFKEYEFMLNGMNKFKGYKCTPASYQINMDGKIESTCTRRKIPLQLSNKNLIVTEICPVEVCPSRRLINFYKERV
jgi:hypothetical protein